MSKEVTTSPGEDNPEPVSENSIKLSIKDIVIGEARGWFGIAMIGIIALITIYITLG